MKTSKEKTPVKAVRIILMPELAVCCDSAASMSDSIAFQEWIIPLEAYEAIKTQSEISARLQVESEIIKQFGEVAMFEPIINYMKFKRMLAEEGRR